MPFRLFGLHVYSACLFAPLCVGLSGGGRAAPGWLASPRRFRPEMRGGPVCADDESTKVEKGMLNLVMGIVNFCARNVATKLRKYGS